MSGLVRNALLELHQQAGADGIGQEFLAAYRTALERLRHSPRSFGEPLYRLPTLHLVARQAIVRPLVVDWAVHETEPLVFIRAFKLLR
jgi:hypothetical protein